MSDEAIPGGLNEDDLATLSTPTGDTPMTDHAEQHSALTDLMKEASDEFVYQDMELTQLDAEVEDIADFLGGIDFTVNYGNATYTYDSRNEDPESGHFWSDKTGFAVRENHYKFNKVDSGMNDLEWDKAIVGDTLNIVEKGNAEDFGTYLITEIIDDGYYNFKVVMTAGNHALNSGGKYDCSVTHKAKQFDAGSGFEHTHDLTEEQIAENRKDIDDIVDFLDGEDDSIPLSSAAWMQTNSQPPESQHMWSDNVDFTKTTQVMMTRTANGGVKPNWDVAREGDELYLQVDYAYTGNHGKFNINKFEITDGDKNPDPDGDYYYMEVEPKSGNQGGAQTGQYTSGHVTHYGLSFPDGSVGGGEIDLTHDHDDEYAEFVHFHDGNYATIGHDHDDDYLEKTGGEINGKLAWPYSQKEALSFHTNSKGEPKQLTFGTTSNYWEHVWEGDSHQKMKWHFHGKDVVSITEDELDMHDNKIIHVKDPTSDSHAATKRYVDNAVSLGTAGISTASVGDNALILGDKLNTIEERLDSLEFVEEGAGQGTGNFKHGNYQEPGCARVYAAQGQGLGNFAINMHDKDGNTFIPPVSGETFTYKINETEYSFEVDGVYPAGDTIAIQGPITVASVEGDTITVEVEMTGESGHDHEQYVTRAELAAYIEKDEETYRYHHATMWYEVPSAAGEAWWSDSHKFLLNPVDLDGKEPSDVTFAPGKTIGLHFVKKDGTEQVAMVEFQVMSYHMSDMGYWEVLGEASDDFPGAKDNVMVIYATLPDEAAEHEHEEIEELEGKVTSLENDVDKNAQDIKSLAASLADTMEVITLVNSRDWKYSGENKNPRSQEFSTDSWYFNKVALIKINKQDAGGSQHSWKDIVVGDEINIRYNEDETQPIGDRYQGKFLVTSVVAKGGDTLTVGVAFVSGFGTIIDNKKYTISIRGTRAVDMQAKLQEAMQAAWGKKFDNDTGYLPYANNSEIKAGAFCWDGSRDTIYLSNKDKYGNQWYTEHHTYNSLEKIGSIYSIQDDGTVKLASRFVFTDIEYNTNNVKLSGVQKLMAGSLSNRTPYLINLGSWM